MFLSIIFILAQAYCNQGNDYFTYAGTTMGNHYFFIGDKGMIFFGYQSINVFVRKLLCHIVEFIIMAIDFIGHKNQLLEFITLNICNSAKTSTKCIADLFCGTGSVSAAFKSLGYRVIANDNLVWCTRFAEAILFNSKEPRFEGIIHSVQGSEKRLLDPQPYDHVLAYLNSLEPSHGFIFENYSPHSGKIGTHLRMYFTENNAGRIDRIRRQIRDWEGQLTLSEKALLITDLIKAANSVSNIAGTYGSYMKYWKRRAKQNIELSRSRIVAGSLDNQVYNKDANVLASSIEAPIVYADPPYTKRQYAAYYHLLETIAVGDEPEIIGSTGLRSWEDKASDYCYKRKAPSALEDLISKIDCQHFFLSYNEDGQIPHKKLLEILSKYGKVQYNEIINRRYKSSIKPHKGNEVIERLYHLNFRSCTKVT